MPVDRTPPVADIWVGCILWLDKLLVGCNGVDGDVIVVLATGGVVPRAPKKPGASVVPVVVGWGFVAGRLTAGANGLVVAGLLPPKRPPESVEAGFDGAVYVFVGRGGLLVTAEVAGGLLVFVPAVKRLAVEFVEASGIFANKFGVWFTLVDDGCGLVLKRFMLALLGTEEVPLAIPVFKLVTVAVLALTKFAFVLPGPVTPGAGCGLLVFAKFAFAVFASGGLVRSMKLLLGVGLGVLVKLADNPVLLLAILFPRPPEVPKIPVAEVLVFGNIDVEGEQLDGAIGGLLLFSGLVNKLLLACLGALGLKIGLFGTGLLLELDALFPPILLKIPPVGVLLGVIVLPFKKKLLFEVLEALFPNIELFVVLLTVLANRLLVLLGI